MTPYVRASLCFALLGFAACHHAPPPAPATAPKTVAFEVERYGEERPVCREEQESCWRRNRRDEFTTPAGAATLGGTARQMAHSRGGFTWR